MPPCRHVCIPMMTRAMLQGPVLQPAEQRGGGQRGQPALPPHPPAGQQQHPLHPQECFHRYTALHNADITWGTDSDYHR